MPQNFPGSPRPTLGVEWELAFVDSDTGDLVPRAADIIDAIDTTDSPYRLDKEFLANTVEIVTGVCDNAPAAAQQLAAAYRELDDKARGQGLALWTGGSHPTTDFRTQHIAEHARYAEILERTQYWGRHMLIWGLHVHVGVRDKDRVWPIIGGLMTLLPVMLAYSASSPAWAGEDTGYASNRTMLYQQLPTAGIPYDFRTWEEYEAFMVDQETSGVVSHTGSMHFDIRPACEHSTIEVRVCDAPATLWETTALVAFIHCAVIFYDRMIDDGATPPSLPYWHNAENKWRAARYGDEAIIITDRDTHEAPVAEVLEAHIEAFLPIAEELGCADELLMMKKLVAQRPGFARQRGTHTRTGSWGDVVRETVQQLRDSVGVE